jgi:hypothetical protein
MAVYHSPRFLSYLPLETLLIMLDEDALSKAVPWGFWMKNRVLILDEDLI